MSLKGLVASLDGKTVYQTELQGGKFNGKSLGRAVGRTLLDMGGDKIMQEIHSA